ncbi:MAG: alpha/beta fold hydrolase [Planctomycetota bacterium]|nr:alpha/beta fold hydrolase [Planctomycetota bacterium]
MNEVGYFRSGNNELSYSCVIPPAKVKKTGIVFVHAADGNRLGPHRMFVELANNFNSLGCPTLRFDLSGCGDSTGSFSGSNIVAEVLDVVEAARFFVNRVNLESVILFGISRGSRVCYTAMTQNSLPLRGMILLSTPAPSNKAALKSFGARLREYTCKLKDPKHLWKLLSGRANISQIWQTLVTALQLSKRYAREDKKRFASRCPMLFIYGGLDPIGEESSQYYTRRCRENDLPYQCHFIAGANHSFFHYKWKEEIFSVSKRWLVTILS